MAQIQLKYRQPAIRDIQKLDPVTKRRLKVKIEFYRDRPNPLRYAVKLAGPAGKYRWKIGNYRVIFDVEGKTYWILRVAHRREVYRRR